jgi:hypothetical protein
MTIIESKVKQGTFTLGTAPDDFDTSCQTSSIAIVPQYEEEGDDLEVLCGDTLGKSKTRGNNLVITAVQDFEDPAGFSAWAWEHDLEVVPFAFAPTGTTGPSYSGSVEVQAGQIGGEVGERIFAELEWICVGVVTRTEGTP